jgi:hypothetical protein
LCHSVCELLDFKKQAKARVIAAVSRHIETTAWSTLFSKLAPAALRRTSGSIEITSVSLEFYAYCVEAQDSVALEVLTFDSGSADNFDSGKPAIAQTIKKMGSLRESLREAATTTEDRLLLKALRDGWSETIVLWELWLCQRQALLAFREDLLLSERTRLKGLVAKVNK